MRSGGYVIFGYKRANFCWGMIEALGICLPPPSFCRQLIGDSSFRIIIAKTFFVIIMIYRKMCSWAINSVLLGMSTKSQLIGTGFRIKLNTCQNILHSHCEQNFICPYSQFRTIIVIKLNLGLVWVLLLYFVRMTNFSGQKSFSFNVVFDKYLCHKMLAFQRPC